MCPQALPLWNTQGEAAFLLSYLYNQSISVSSNISSYTYKPAAQDPRTTEDCLFLDVVVPKKIFDRGQKAPTRKNLAPVLVWIYGGGYVAGEKSSSDASGLVHRSMAGGDDGIVFVSLNYRVSIIYSKSIIGTHSRSL